MASPKAKGLSDVFTNTANSDEKSNFTVICGTAEFYVHRYTLYSHAYNLWLAWEGDLMASGLDIAVWSSAD